MEVGATFVTLEEAEEKILSFMKENYHPVRKDHSESVHCYNRKVKTKVLENVPVYTVTWVCKHAGKIRHRGKGTRKRVVMALGCPFRLKLTYNLIRKLYVIAYFETSHNHDIGEAIFRNYATSRKPDAEVRSLMIEMLQSGNKIQSVADYAHSQGVFVTPKDVNNMRRELKDFVPRPRKRAKITSISQTIPVEITSNPDFNYKIIRDKSKSDEIEAVFLTSNKQIELATKFNEVMILDATFKESGLLWPVYTICILDEELIAQPVAYCVMPQLSLKSAEFLNWWRLRLNEVKPKCFFVENNEDDVKSVKKYFPTSFIAFLRFNCVAQMNGFLDSAEFTSEMKDSCRSYFVELLHSTTKDECTKIFQVVKTKFQPFSEYLERDWLPHEKEFCGYSRRWKFHLDPDHTYNHLQNLHEIYNSVFATSSGSEVSSALSEFAKITNVKNSEYDQHESMTVIDEGLVKFKKEFSGFAFENILKEFDRSRDFVVEKSEENACFFAKHKETNKIQELDDNLICPCTTAVCLGLCCRHVFAVQKYLNETTYLPQLVSERWELKREDEFVTQVLSSFSKLTDVQARYNAVMKDCQDLCHWISTRPDGDYDVCYNKFLDMKEKIMNSETSADHNYTICEIANTSEVDNPLCVQDSIVFVQLAQDPIGTYTAEL